MLFLVALIKDTGMGSFNNPEFSLGPGPPSPNSTHSDPYPISGLLCEETFVTISKLTQPIPWRPFCGLFTRKAVSDLVEISNHDPIQGHSSDPSEGLILPHSDNPNG